MTLLLRFTYLNETNFPVPHTNSLKNDFKCHSF